MAKHRSFKLDKFLKSVDPGLRARYFKKYNLTFPTDISFDDDSLDDFLESIVEDKRAEIEDELQCINDIADEARDCLEQACQEFAIKKQDDETSETTAMRVFLKGDDAFALALDAYLYCVLSEKLSHHKFKTGTAKFSEAPINKFKTAVEVFFKECGKSDHCAIRHRVDGKKHILLIARGDFMRTHLVFDDQKGKTDVKSFRPAKEDMLVYNTENSVLSMCLSGRSDDEKRKYLEMFGGTFLGLTQIDASTLNNSLVDIDPIKKRTFDFNGNEQIEAVKLIEVNAKVANGAVRLIVKSNNLTDTKGYGIGADGNAEFVSAKLKFFIKREGKKSKGYVVEIRPPENSKIPQKKEKQIIESYLREQGVLLG